MLENYRVAFLSHWILMQHNNIMSIVCVMRSFISYIGKKETDSNDAEIDM